MTTPQERTAKANQVRRTKFLERKADEYAAALRELGYTVIAPGDVSGRRCTSCARYCVGCPDHEACSQGGCHLDGGPVKPLPVCPLCGGVNGHASICDYYERES